MDDRVWIPNRRMNGGTPRLLGLLKFQTAQGSDTVLHQENEEETHDNAR